MFRQFHASLAAVLLCTAALAQVPIGTVFTYQGQIKQGGEAVTGPIDLEFRLFNVPSNGAAIGSQGMDAVHVKDGLFTVQLDFGSEPFAAGEALWLEVVADGTPLAPRQPLTNAPYSLATRGINVTSGGNVGIGTSTPEGRLDVVSPFRLLGAPNSPTFLMAPGPNGSYADMYVQSPSDNKSLRLGGGGDLLPSRGAVFQLDGINAGGNARLHAANGGSILLSNGNVGVGNESPESKLHVNGSLTLQGATVGEARLVFKSTGAGGHQYEWYPDSTEPGSLQLFDRTTGFAPITVRGNGNVGIGISDPQTSLHVRTSGWPSSEVRFSRAGSDQILRLDPDGGQTNQSLILEATAGDNLSLSARWDAYYLAGSAPSKSLLIGAGGRNNDLILYPNGSVALGINGSVGIGNSPNPSAKLDVAGVARCDVLEIDGGADISEPFHINPSGAAPQPGHVVCIDPGNPERLTLSTTPYDRRVAGIISGAGGVKPGITLRQEGTVADGTHPVALTGRVYVWCDADEGGRIAAGDLLTTSATPGHAMKANDANRLVGTVLGKAMTSLDSGRGLVLVIVGLQ